MTIRNINYYDWSMLNGALTDERGKGLFNVTVNIREMDREIEKGRNTDMMKVRKAELQVKVGHREEQTEAEIQREGWAQRGID